MEDETTKQYRRQTESILGISISPGFFREFRSEMPESREEWDTLYSKGTEQWRNKIALCKARYKVQRYRRLSGGYIPALLYQEQFKLCSIYRWRSDMLEWRRRADKSERRDASKMSKEIHDFWMNYISHPWSGGPLRAPLPKETQPPVKKRKEMQTSTTPELPIAVLRKVQIEVPCKTPKGRPSYRWASGYAITAPGASEESFPWLPRRDAIAHCEAHGWKPLFQ
jgi:hypothetical protein